MSNNSRQCRTANPQYAEAMRQLRRSNAAQPYDTRPHRQRTRQAVQAAAIRDWD